MTAYSGKLVVLIALMGGVALLTHHRVQRWATDATLWESEQRADPSSARALINLGRAYDLESRWALAEVYDHRAITESENNRRDPASRGELWEDGMTNLAHVYMNTGRAPLAQIALEQVVARDPDRASVAVYNLAILALRRQDCAEANAYVQRAHVIDERIPVWTCGLVAR